MALYDTIKSKISRQELVLDVDSRNFKQYSARVKYLPENVEKDDFFSLCCGVLKAGDIVVIRTKVDKTNPEESYDVVYKFLVLYANADEQKVDVMKLLKVDMLNPVPEVDGVDMTALSEAVKAIVEASLKGPVAKLDELTARFEAYTTETDDQLEEIENNIARLNSPILGEAADDVEDEDDVEDAAEDE